MRNILVHTCFNSFRILLMSRYSPFFFNHFPALAMRNPVDVVSYELLTESGRFTMRQLVQKYGRTHLERSIFLSWGSGVAVLSQVSASTSRRRTPMQRYQTRQ